MLEEEYPKHSRNPLNIYKFPLLLQTHWNYSHTHEKKYQ